MTCVLSRPNPRGVDVDLTLATSEVDGATIIAVGGEIDVYTAPKLRDKITELVGDGIYDIIVDMEAVEFLDSLGVGEICVFEGRERRLVALGNRVS